jgi:uncharacterized protein
MVRLNCDNIVAMHKIAVVSDTHVPDKIRSLNPNLIPALLDYSPELIIHAGDFVTYRIKKKFEEIAPLVGVKGNRDLLMVNLPHKYFLTVDEIKIGITHGHGTFLSYLFDRLSIVLSGPKSFEFFERKVKKILAGVDVMVYGHSHCPLIRKEKDYLLFNPGSPSVVNQFYPQLRPSIGVLEIDGSQIYAKIIFLDK